MVCVNANILALSSRLTDREDEYFFENYQYWLWKLYILFKTLMLWQCVYKNDDFKNGFQFSISIKEWCNI